MKINLNIELKEGDIVEIYTDYQDEIGYEGKAVLLEKIKDGDSFYLTNELLEPKDKSNYSKEEKENIRKYNKLVTFFKGNKNKKADPYCRRLYRDLLKERLDEIDDFHRMKRIIQQYRLLYQGSIKRIGTILREYDDYYLSKFVHQDRVNWRPSIFSYERWKIRFIEDYTGWKVDWITSRNIRILKCINPNENMRKSELVEHTTYNGGISSRIYTRVLDIKRYVERKKLEEEKNDSEFIDDNKMEELIITKLNNINEKKKD